MANSLNPEKLKQYFLTSQVTQPEQDSAQAQAQQEQKLANRNADKVLKTRVLKKVSPQLTSSQKNLHGAV